MRARSPQVGVVLTAQHRAGRLAFAREHQDWQIHHWRPVLFTDESRFTLSTCDSPCFKDITSKLDQPVVWFSTLILSVTPNPDLHGLINLISIDHFCVILLSAHSTM
ncbi:unnamed protein product [Oncorhynchus mykiss]|uniref:Transposase Tc1-like domain-containing protein n=1 Tax=Oncorhynchus mykiss TaxID=8022 RepID=A0A060ZIZ2_ONCMY|nr:unnamed protein product [Oncorhynchus mykiss]